MHDHHHHHHHAAGASVKLLLLSLVLTLVFASIEALAGWWAQSLALLGDAGHMLSDAVALGLAGVAAWMAKHPPSARHSYGLGRIEVIAAVTNGLFMLAIVTGITVYAFERMRQPIEVAGGTVALVAIVGLVVNLLVIRLLSQGESSLNVRGALLHVVGDLLGSVAALISGIVIYFTGWSLIDPVLSLVICAIILFSSITLLREAMHVLMEGVPPHIDLPAVGDAIVAHDSNIVSVHDLHIWSLSSGKTALSAHVVINDLSLWDALLRSLEHMLHDAFGIDHVTLQAESTPVHKLSFHQMRP